MVWEGDRANGKSSNQRVSFAFFKEDRALDEGRWFKKELLDVAVVMTITFILIALLMWFIRRSVVAALVFLIGPSPVSIYLFYGAFQRKGWEFKKTDYFAPEDVASRLIRAFNENRINYREIEMRKFFLANKWSRTFVIGNTIVSVMNTDTSVLLGVKDDNQDRIKNLLDTELSK